MNQVAGAAFPSIPEMYARRTYTLRKKFWRSLGIGHGIRVNRNRRDIY